MNNNTSIQLASNDEILIYQSEDGTIKVDVLYRKIGISDFSTKSTNMCNTIRYL